MTTRLAALAVIAAAGRAAGVSISRNAPHIAGTPHRHGLPRTPGPHVAPYHNARCAPAVCQANPPPDGDEEPDAINRMLDAPIIDPYSESDDDPGWLRSYKKLIREDYQTAEAIWAGVIVTTFIFFAQQMVRAYKSMM